jgi:fructokinase
VRRILCVGDACEDILIPYGAALRGQTVFPQFSLGGSMADAASGLGRLGVACGFQGKAGADYAGKRMKNALAADGVDVSHMKLDPALTSTQIIIVLDENNDRFPFLMPSKPQAYLEVYPEDLPDTLLDEYDVVLTSGLMLFAQPAAQTVCSFLERCRQRGITVALDINLRIETLHGDLQHLKRAVACTNYLFGSAEEELLPLSGMHDVESAARSLVNERCTVIARMGAQGSTVYSTQGASHCAAFPIQVADTLGAGDSFNSGFLYALSRGWSLETANICGSAAAALNSTKVGARNCPTQEELLAFLAQNKISLQ